MRVLYQKQAWQYDMHERGLAQGDKVLELYWHVGLDMLRPIEVATDH